MERVLIFAPNWLGDAVMALPAIADVRRALPAATLTVAARPAVAGLFDLVRDVDEVNAIGAADHSVSKASLAGQFGGARATSGYEVALLLTNSFHTALLAYRAGIPERWGYRGDWRRILLTRAVRRPRRGHQVAYYQHLVAALGMANGPSMPAIELPPAAIDRGAAKLRAAGWNGRAPLVSLAPGAAYGSAKRWPPSYFGELARAFFSDGVRAVMVGGAAEAPTGREIEAAAGPAVVLNLIGQTTLVELAGVLRNCSAMVSNDSGAMHLGAALGVPVTAMFGPTRERETAPRDRVTVLTNPVWCRPCMLRECPLDHACMKGITVARVREATKVSATVDARAATSAERSAAGNQPAAISDQQPAASYPPPVAIPE